MSRAEPIDPGMLGKDMPLLEKLTVHLLEDKPGTLDVTLTVPLDENAPDERAAIEQFSPDDATLDVHYLVKMNLQAEREELSKRFGETYRKHAGAKMARRPGARPRARRRPARRVHAGRGAGKLGLPPPLRAAPGPRHFAGLRGRGRAHPFESAALRPRAQASRGREEPV